MKNEDDDDGLGIFKTSYMFSLQCTVSSYVFYWENIGTACYVQAFETCFLFIVSKKQCRHLVSNCIFVNLDLSVDIPCG
jgi:hypothetical protein